jgi:hypothetical protein
MPSSLKKLLSVDLPITSRHDRWLGLHADDPLPRWIADWVAGQLVSPKRNRNATFSASATGRCERQQVLRFIGHPESESYDPALNHRFQVGDWGHLRWQAQGLAAGWLSKAEVPVRLEEYGLTGTLDGVTDKDEGFEFKTIRQPGFNMVMKDGEPKFDHVLQVTAYMIATGIRRFSLVYESTFSGEWKEFVVVYSPDLAALVIETLERMAASVHDKQLPPVLPDCEQKIGSVYADCPYRKDCLSWHRGGVAWPSRMLRIPTTAGG